MHDNETVFRHKVEAALSLIGTLHCKPFGRALVVGCGSGAEAELLALRLNCQVDAIDLSPAYFLPARSPLVCLHVMDAAAMSFDDQTFDLLYTFHALEHIQNLEKAMSEMKRVLKPGACVFVGVPNKRRIIGYVGSPTTFWNKIAWNFADWSMRLRGTWENGLGAHAGFSQPELESIISGTFGDVQDQTLHYYRSLYPRHQRAIYRIEQAGLAKFLFPAVYVSAINRPDTSLGAC